MERRLDDAQGRYTRTCLTSSAHMLRLIILKLFETGYIEFLKLGSF